MALNFPNNPSNGQQYTLNGITWTYNSAVGSWQGGGAMGPAGPTALPINSQSANYTTVIGDGGACILHPASDANARTFTIAANATVPYPLGTTITFANQTAQALSVAIATDTLTFAGGALTGTRSLGQNGLATALKIASTSWLISGTGLS